MPGLSAAGRASLTKQLDTVEGDIDRMKNGKLSYCEMRARYG